MERPIVNTPNPPHISPAALSALGHATNNPAHSPTPPPGSHISPDLWTAAKSSGANLTPQILADLAFSRFRESVIKDLSSPASPRIQAIIREAIASRRPEELGPEPTDFMPTREEWRELIGLLDAQIESARMFAAAVSLWAEGRAEHVDVIEDNSRAMRELAVELRRRNDHDAQGDEWRGGADDLDADEERGL